MDVDTYINLERLVRRDDWKTDDYTDLWKGIIKRLPPGKHYKKAIDMGCGHGQLAHLLCDVADEVVAVDAFDEMLREVPKNAPKAKPVKSSMLMVDMTGADLVVFCESLYYQAPGEQVRLLLRAAAQRADVVVTFPNVSVTDATLRVVTNCDLYVTQRSNIIARGATKHAVVMISTDAPLVRQAQPSDKDAIWRGLHGCSEETTKLYCPFLYTEATAKELSVPGYQALRGTTVFIIVLDETMAAIGRIHQTGDSYGIDCMVPDPFRLTGLGDAMLDHLLAQVPTGKLAYTFGGTHKGERLHWMLRKRGFLESADCPLSIPRGVMPWPLVMMTKVM